MMGTLARLLRIRGLIEEQRRIELERESARLLGIEQTSARAAAEARERRGSWFLELTSPEPGAGRLLSAEGDASGEPSSRQEQERQEPEGGEAGSRAVSKQEAGSPCISATGLDQQKLRHCQEAAWEQAVARRARAEAELPAQERRVNAARQEFLAGRCERLQLESLVERATAAEAVQRERREQRQLDDWFQHRPRRRS